MGFVKEKLKENSQAMKNHPLFSKTPFLLFAVLFFLIPGILLAEDPPSGPNLKSGSLTLGINGLCPYPKDSIQFDIDSVLCRGDSLSIVNHSFACPGATFSWDFGVDAAPNLCRV